MFFFHPGTGKTHTMSAIYEYAAVDVFDLLQESPTSAVSVSFFELAGDFCFDMLNMFEPAQLMTGRDGSVHAFPLVEVQVKRASDLTALINHGRAVRSTASTGVNDTSSRSHAILRIYISTIEQMGGADEGVLTLVDLAGSEHRIDSMYHGAERRKEGAVINASLMALKDCVRARASGKNFSHQYRKNKLTMALKSSFMLPAAKTVIIATVSPASKDTEHSLNTLRHACIMDGQQSNSEEDETRFITGGIKKVECIGEVDITGISRRRRLDAKQGNSAKHDARVSNGNEARPDERILTDTEKAKLRRAAEKKAFAKLTTEQKIMLQDCRNVLGRNPAQEARLSRLSTDDNAILTQSSSKNENIDKISDAAVGSSCRNRSLNLVEYNTNHINPPTQRQNERLVEMGFKNPESIIPNPGIVHNSPPRVSSAARPLSSSHRNDMPFSPGIQTAKVKSRVVSSPISRPGANSSCEEGYDLLDRNPTNGKQIRLSKDKVEEFTTLQAQMFAARDVPFEVIKRTFVSALKQKGFTSSEIKALVIAQTGGKSDIIIDDSLGCNPCDISEDKQNDVSVLSIPVPASTTVVISKEKKSIFKKLKASVFHGSEMGVCNDILLRQLVLLLKQQDFTKAEISYFVKKLTEVPTLEEAKNKISPLRNSSSADSFRRVVRPDADLGNQPCSEKPVDGPKSTPGVNRKTTRLSRRSVLWRPTLDNPPTDGNIAVKEVREIENSVPVSSASFQNKASPFCPPDIRQDSEIAKLEKQIATQSLSEATKFGLKKRLAAMKATILRAEKKVEQNRRERSRFQHRDIADRKLETVDPQGKHLSVDQVRSGQPLSSHCTSSNNGIADSSTRIHMAAPFHVESITQPDMLDRYTDAVNEKVDPTHAGTENTKLTSAMKGLNKPQNYSSPPSAYISGDRNSEKQGHIAAEVLVRKPCIGAVSAPFANEMNWNMYM